MSDSLDHLIEIWDQMSHPPINPFFNFENLLIFSQISSHIFKRLKWLGNKYYSHLITLLYLAVWHGYHLGYFMLFAFEFMCMVAQEQVFLFNFKELFD